MTGPQTDPATSASVTDRPLTVLLVGPASSIHLSRWANGLAAHGQQVHVASVHSPADQHYDPRVSLHRLTPQGGIGYVAAAPALRALVRRLSPDLVNTHYATGYGTLAHLGLLGSSVPTLLSVWGSDVYDTPYESRAKGAMVRINLRAADLLGSTSHCMAAQVDRLTPGRQIEITPFGVDTELFSPTPEPSDHTGQPLVIGTVKSLYDKYGVDLLIRAFAGLVRQRPERELRLLVVGKGPQRPELDALVSELGLDQLVTITDAVPHDQVPSLLHQMDIYAALSRLDSESFGVAIVEASACGLPVVVSDAQGPAEVTLDGITGLIVPKLDVAAATAALATLVDDAELRQRMGTAGRSHAVAQYEWNHCVAHMIEVYRWLVAHPQRH